MSNIEQKISQAKARLLVEYPYFGTLASKLKLIANDNIESFKSNGIELEYNDEYLDTLDAKEVEFILANGAMHASLAHDIRKNNRSGWLWQMATDFAINDMLVENGLTLPEKALYEERFKGMYAEEIYAELKDDIIRKDEDLEYESDSIEDVENNTTRTKEQVQEEILKERLLAEEAISLLESEFKKGEAPKTIDRFFKLTCNGKVDWRSELKAALDRFYKDDYTLMPPSKKFLHLDLYLPSSTADRFNLVVAIDSSGSVDEKLLGEFLSELDFLMNTISNYQIDLLVCDDKIHSHKIFYGGDILQAEIKGGGGTDFRAVFEFIENELNDVKLLLYFTDLDGIFPKKEPNFSVKWVSPKESEVPFGEVILLQD